MKEVNYCTAFVQSYVLKHPVMALALPSIVAIGGCCCCSPHNRKTGHTCNSCNVVSMWSNIVEGTIVSSSITIKSYLAGSQLICGLSFASTRYLNALWIVFEEKPSSVMIELYVTTVWEICDQIWKEKQKIDNWLHFNSGWWGWLMFKNKRDQRSLSQCMWKVAREV